MNIDENAKRARWWNTTLVVKYKSLRFFRALAEKQAPAPRTRPDKVKMLKSKMLFREFAENSR